MRLHHQEQLVMKPCYWAITFKDVIADTRHSLSSSKHMVKAYVMNMVNRRNRHNCIFIESSGESFLRIWFDLNRNGLTILSVSFKLNSWRIIWAESSYISHLFLTRRLKLKAWHLVITLLGIIWITRQVWFFYWLLKKLTKWATESLT